MSSFPFESLGDWIEFLKERGEVHENSKPVETRNEIAAIARKVCQTGGRAVLHDNIEGYPGWRMFHDGFSTRDRIATVFGEEGDTFPHKTIERLKTAKPIKPKVVETGPCKEVKIVGDDIDLTYLPLPFTAEFEGPPFITSGISNLKDPDTGWQNTGIRRFQLKGKRKINNLVLPFQHEGIILSKYIDRNEPAPIAIVIGADPLYQLSSQIPAATQVDEMDVWGAIAGKPLEVVRCETSDILVPATAEIVLEGVMQPSERDLEGAFSEFTGYNSILRKAPIVRIQAVTMRKAPIFQYIYNGGPYSEGLSMGSTVNEIELYRQLKAVAPEIEDIALLSSWGGVTAVSVKRAAKEKLPGVAKRIAFCIKSIKAAPFVKNVVVVDEEVDVRDPNHVLWCFSTRFQGAKDITVIPGTPGTFLDPSELWLGMGPGYSSYTIFDCTEKLPPYDESYQRGLAAPAVEEMERIAREWGANGYDG